MGGISRLADAMTSEALLIAEQAKTGLNLNQVLADVTDAYLAPAANATDPKGGKLSRLGKDVQAHSGDKDPGTLQSLQNQYSQMQLDLNAARDKADGYKNQEETAMGRTKEMQSQLAATAQPILAVASTTAGLLNW